MTTTLQQLLEAGCHFGHKRERWNPRATEFIFAEKDGIHIIDLVKTKKGLEDAMQFVTQIVSEGKEVLFVGTKRQAKDIVKKVAIEAGAPYIAERWIGGFLTNWEGIHKNIQKIIHLDTEKNDGTWKKKRYPKHEQVKLTRYLERLKVFYGGVLTLHTPPAAVFIIDVKKESAAVREAVRCEYPVIGIVDTNSDPSFVAYTIPANDDAIGSIEIITKAIGDAYKQGKKIYAKNEAERLEKLESAKPKTAPKPEIVEEKEKKEQEIEIKQVEQAVKKEKPVKSKKTKTKKVEGVK